MTASLFTLALFMCTQTPDGAGPAVTPAPTVAPAAQPEAAPPVEATPPVVTGAPAAQAAPAEAQAPVVPAEQAAPAKKDDAKGKEKKDHLSGLFVGAVGAAAVCLALVLGSVSASYSLIKELPFPAGSTERASFVTSTLVGAMFLASVGSVVFVAGVALLAVSFL